MYQFLQAMKVEHWLQLAISPDTVDDHVKAIYRHLNIGSATELAALFIRNR
jgi:DNA-binding NarL/FixJ family response regulator